MTADKFAITDKILTYIRSRDMQVGDRLPTERELGQLFGVSRTRIREGLKALEAQGWVIVRPGSGSYVRSGLPSSADLRMVVQGQNVASEDIFEVRKCLEVQIVRLAAARASTEHIAMLQEVCDIMEQLASEKSRTKDNFERFLNQDKVFHRLLARASGNQLYVLLQDALQDVVDEVRRQASRQPGAIDRAVLFHRAITDAVKKRDPDTAGAVMTVHLADADTLLGDASEENKMSASSHNSL